MELRAYFATAFAISWGGLFLLMALRTGLHAGEAGGPTSVALAFLAMIAGPSIASFALTAWFAGPQGLRRLLARLGRFPSDVRAYATLLVAPAILALVLFALSAASRAYVPAILWSASPSSFAVTAAIAGFGAGFFEELGWTGFATPRLLERGSWLRAGASLGVLWALWHGLGDFWGGGARWGALWGPHFVEWVVALAAFRMFMTWVYARERSVPLAMLLHASFTGTQSLAWPAAASPREELLWYGVFALCIAILAAVVALPRCGATRFERRRAMHGDALVPEPMFAVTHAITIDAPPDRVWRWLAQMGADRAGWYGWDRIDNGGAPSADRVREDLQELHAGDVLPAIPGAREDFAVTLVEPPRDLVLAVTRPGGIVVSWEHRLEPLGSGRTRLLARGRVSRRWATLARGDENAPRPAIFIERVYRVLGRLPRWLLALVGGAGHRVMEARHLRGIKRRAEAEVAGAAVI